ncbi:MAG: septum formation initiator family protein [Bdellovibrionales bacterium]|nr:septum formation initiator family protein [Bdellovibrionales bacterium]
MFKAIGSKIHGLISSPKKMLVFCLALIFFALIIDGTLFRLWKLHHDFNVLTTNLEEEKERLKILEVQVQRAKDPVFIKHQARDRFDLVEEDEMVFFFTKSE